jgi:phosphatidylinositol alpha-1,6-mannosyltransferase
MRTLILTEHFLPSVGGSINWLVNTYGRYPSDEVVFVASQHEREQLIDRTLPFRVERIPMTMRDWDPTVPKSLCRYLHIIWHVRTYCSKYCVRQVHCAKVLPEGLVAWCINFYWDIPYVLYAHGEEIQVGLTSRKFQWLIPRICNHAAAIIANSRNTQSLLQKIGVCPGKIHIIHPGVNARAFRLENDSSKIVRKALNIGESPLILTVGRLQRRKGHDMIIKALPHVKRTIPNVMYLIVGTGEEFCNLKKLISDVGVTESVIFVGRVSDEDLPYYYAACDVFVMPNREIDADIEGFGMVYLEAAAAGKPVIGGRSGGTDDAILEGTTGLRVDGNSITEIANAMVSLLSNPEKSKLMGESGRRWVEKEFTWESVVRRTYALSSIIPQMKRTS